MPTSTAPAKTVLDLNHIFENQTHWEWAADIARGVARRAGIDTRDAACDDLISTAHFIMFRRASGQGLKHFEPDRAAGGSVHGQFRGWVHSSILWECIRALQRLRGGGTFRTPESEGALSVRVQSLPAWTDELGVETGEAALIDHRTGASEDTDDGGEEIPPTHHTAPPAPLEPPPPRPAAQWRKCRTCGNRNLLRTDESRACLSCHAPLRPARVRRDRSTLPTASSTAG